MGGGFFVAVMVGVGVAVQVSVLGRSAGNTNPLAVSLALQISGVLVAAVWASNRGAWPDVLDVSRNWWWIPLGAGGWAVVAALGFASNKIGVAATLGLSLTAQLLAALIIDATRGTGHIGIQTSLGVGLILSGAIMVAT
jgi:uncharacterized membrane protein YdcZ (DUF606 family)